MWWLQKWFSAILWPNCEIIHWRMVTMTHLFQTKVIKKHLISYLCFHSVVIKFIGAGLPGLQRQLWTGPCLDFGFQYAVIRNNRSKKFGVEYWELPGSNSPWQPCILQVWIYPNNDFVSIMEPPSFCWTSQNTQHSMRMQSLNYKPLPGTIEVSLNIWLANYCVRISYYFTQEKCYDICFL